MYTGRIMLKVYNVAEWAYQVQRDGIPKPKSNQVKASRRKRNSVSEGWRIRSKILVFM